MQHTLFTAFLAFPWRPSLGHCAQYELAVFLSSLRNASSVCKSSSNYQIIGTTNLQTCKTAKQNSVKRGRRERERRTCIDIVERERERERDLSIYLVERERALHMILMTVPAVGIGILSLYSFPIQWIRACLYSLLASSQVKYIRLSSELTMAIIPGSMN